MAVEIEVVVKVVWWSGAGLGGLDSVLALSVSVVVVVEVVQVVMLIIGLQIRRSIYLILLTRILIILVVAVSNLYS